MSNNDMEAIFKFIFFLAIIIFCVVVVGFFLLGLKFTLNFIPEINLMGMTITSR